MSCGNRRGALCLALCALFAPISVTSALGVASDVWVTSEVGTTTTPPADLVHDGKARTLVTPSGGKSLHGGFKQ